MAGPDGRQAPPSPDDPRYRERLGQGPPLDEWEEVDSPAGVAEAKRRHRADERLACIILAAVVVVALAFVVFAAVRGTDAPSDGLEACGQGVRPCLIDPDNVLLGNNRIIPLEQFDAEAYEAREQILDCPAGPSSGC